MKILKIYLAHLRNEAHYQFMMLVAKLFDAHPSVMAIVTALLIEYTRLVELEGKLVDFSRASKYTELLAELDRKLDQYIIGFNYAIDSALKHYDPTIVEAAKIIEVRMKAFNGSIDKKSYEEESAAVKILVADLKTTYQPQIAILKLEDWVMTISNTQSEFEQLFIERNVELANRPSERLRDVKKDVNAMYYQIVERIDAYNILNTDAEVIAFVNELNNEITYFNEHSHRHAKKDISKANIETIADQVYTGEPVIVLPKVTFEGKNLIFSRDYEVTYKNNVQPGTATLTIHGKGRFNNTFMTTFNIIESK
jgi:hypothetical protein